MIGIMSLAIMLSASLTLGSAWTLAPIIVVFVLIIAAAGLTRGGDFFSFLGIGALLGITSGVGKGGAGKGLRSASAIGRRSIKKNVKSMNPLKKKAEKLGKASAIAKIRQKQAKVVGKIGEATRLGNTAKAEQLKQKLVDIEAKKVVKFGKESAGMVNQAVKMHKGGILGANAETQRNLAAGFAYLDSSSAASLAASEAGIAMARTAAAAAGRSTIAGWSAGATLKQTIRQHNAMQNLFGEAGGFSKAAANPPKSSFERLSDWISHPSVPSAFQKQNLLGTLTPWVPGLGAVLIGYGAYQVTKGTIAQGYRTATAQSTATQAQAARNATATANAYASAAQVANTTAAAQFTAAQAAVSGGATVLATAQTSNTNAANSHNTAQVSSTRAKAQSDQAQALAAQAGQQTAAALAAIDQASMVRGTSPAAAAQLTKAKEAATDAAEAANKSRTAAKDAAAAQKGATDAADNAVKAQKDAQDAANKASDAQKELNKQAQLFKTSSDAVARLVQTEADGQRSLAQALTVQASSNDPLIKAQAAKQADAAQAFMDQAREKRAAEEKAMVSYKTGIDDATNKLNTAQADTAAAEKRADTARRDADTAAGKAAAALAAAQAAGIDASAKADAAYTVASKIITDSGATPPAKPAAPAAPIPPPPPKSITPNNPAPLPPPPWGEFTPKPQTLTTIVAPPPLASASTLSDYQDLKDREAAIQDMQTKVDSLRSRASGPTVQKEFATAMHQHADVLEALALAQNTTLLDETTAYRYKAAADQAKDEAKPDKGWLSQYRGFYTPDVERLGHESDVRKDLLKAELGHAWTEEANTYFESVRAKKAEKIVEAQMGAEEEALEARKRAWAHAMSP